MRQQPYFLNTFAFSYCLSCDEVNVIDIRATGSYFLSTSNNFPWQLPEAYAAFTNKFRLVRDSSSVFRILAKWKVVKKSKWLYFRFTSHFELMFLWKAVINFDFFDKHVQQLKNIKYVWIMWPSLKSKYHFPNQHEKAENIHTKN